LNTNCQIRDVLNNDSKQASVRLVLKSNSYNRIKKKTNKKDIRKALENIKHNDDYVENVVDPYDSDQINDEETTAIADIHFLNSQSSLKDESISKINHELDDLKDDHMIQTELAGTS